MQYIFHKQPLLGISIISIVKQALDETDLGQCTEVGLLAKHPMFFSGLTKKCRGGDTSCYYLDQKSAKKPPKNQKTQTTKKDSAFFECKVQFFWRDFSKGFNIPKQNFSVARGQSLRYSFR